jgi:hypothetical protein
MEPQQPSSQNPESKVEPVESPLTSANPESKTESKSVPPPTKAKDNWRTRPRKRKVLTFVFGFSSFEFLCLPIFRRLSKLAKNQEG